MVYQGQFGTYTITERDRAEVIIYRSGLGIAALSFAVGTLLLFWQGTTPVILQTLTYLYGLFSLGLGISLMTIHIYLLPLHRLLQLFWLIGTIAAMIITLQADVPLALYVYNHPLTLFGVGFTFAALTGIFFKEGFCFHRLETQILTPLVPILLLGHLTGLIPSQIESILLATWTALFLVFALRKIPQDIPSDIGDKSVFDYLKQQRAS
ncbi:DUF2301 domain-containing membrane protein [Dactylococcopsis salina]|uniref:Uncharacterized integral membrane protein n=1 Tax=Dactylococcopsis salina (strain PCC 8305) TaxID=13035 RepID=K9YX85_DACS8|nr:DUF2301 domain-containing membrane protein [Dactylococcopsis salina]AFZ51534.1 uncharacterized integral membrane protein [Dactylococcopsis salina PCC 8305]